MRRARGAIGVCVALDASSVRCVTHRAIVVGIAGAVKVSHAFTANARLYIANRSTVRGAVGVRATIGVALMIRRASPGISAIRVRQTLDAIAGLRVAGRRGNATIATRDTL